MVDKKYIISIGGKTKKILERKGDYTRVIDYIREIYPDGSPYHYLSDPEKKEIKKILKRYGIHENDYWYTVVPEKIEERYRPTYERITFSMHPKIKKKKTVFGKIKKKIWAR